MCQTLSSLGVATEMLVVEVIGIGVDDRRNHDTGVFSTVVGDHCHRGMAARGISSETEIVATSFVVGVCERANVWLGE